MRLYKLRKAEKSDKTVSYSLAVPPSVGSAMPADMRFAFELTDEGLLYRPIKETVEDGNGS